MNKTDEYKVFIRKDGTRLYYKNKKLHRTDGPAVIPYEDVEKYTNLADEDLYEKVFEPVILDHFSLTIEKTQSKLHYGNTYRAYFLEPRYYLEDFKVEEKEFYAVLLKEKLDGQLTDSNQPSKKLKV